MTNINTMEIGGEMGSIADFIDRTIVRCLIELDDSEKQSFATNSERTEENCQTQNRDSGISCQNRHQTAMLMPQKQTDTQTNAQRLCRSQAAEYQNAQFQNRAAEFQNQAAKYQNQAAEFQIQEAKYYNQEAKYQNPGGEYRKETDAMRYQNQPLDLCQTQAQNLAKAHQNQTAEHPNHGVQYKTQGVQYKTQVTEHENGIGHCENPAQRKGGSSTHGLARRYSPVLRVPQLFVRNTSVGDNAQFPNAQRLHTTMQQASACNASVFSPGPFSASPGEFTVPLKDLTAPLKDLTVPVKDLTVSSKDLTVPVKDLTVPAKDLTVPVKDLTVPVMDLTVPAKDLTVTAKDLTVYSKDLTVPVKDLTVPAKDLTVPAKDLTVTAKDLTVSAKDLTVTAKDLTAPTKDLTVTAKDLTVPAKDLKQPSASSRETYICNSSCDEDGGDSGDDDLGSEAIESNNDHYSGGGEIIESGGDSDGSGGSSGGISHVEKEDGDGGPHMRDCCVVPGTVGSQSVHKVKKQLQKRYFAEPENQVVMESDVPVQTVRFEGDSVPSWRVKKWKKRRLEPAEKAQDSHSKSELTKRPKEEKPKKGKESKLDEFAEPGFIEYGSDEEATDRLSQTEITEAVDVSSATKYFELNLTDFGPYHINYSRNGRFLLLGGEKGHLAAFDWQTKRLQFEMNPAALDTSVVHSVKWLHQETMLAVAQSSGVYFYDNKGIELHALTNLDSVLRMEFLPHHMLLATANSKGFLGYTDVSMGTRVAGICTGLGQLDVMTQNPANAVVSLGHTSGVVTLWAPSVRKPLVKMLSHKSAVRSLAIDYSGNYMATSGVDKRVKVFDLRTYKMVSSTHVAVGASSLHFSQRGLLAAALGNRVQVYKDCRRQVITPYLSHVTNGSVHSVEFCPFEDVLGAGHQRGFSSLIIPGSGEASYDALSVNPLANPKQRAHAEVRLLLDKLQPEMIGLTNWVWDLSKKAGASNSKSTTGPAGKLGKKQKEELQREKTREQLQAKRKQGRRSQSAKGAKDPLARFKKAKV